MTAVERKLFGYVRRHASALAAALALAILVGSLESASLVLVRFVVDTLLEARPSEFAVPFANLRLAFVPADGSFLLFVLVLITLVKAASEYGGVAVTAFLGQAVVRDIRNDVFSRILRQPLSFFHRNPTGELISRVSADVERIQNAASDTLADFLKHGTIVLFLTAMVFYQDWKLSAMAFVLVPPVLYLTVRFGRRLRALGRSNQVELAAMANVLYEGFSGNRIVKAFLMEDAENRRFRTATEKLFRINMRQRLTHALTSPLMETIGVLVMAVFVLYARTQIAAGHMTAGSFLAYILALVKLYDGIRRMSGINNTFQQAFGAAVRVVEILDLDTERDTGRIAPARFTRAIAFRDVMFAYADGAPVLDGMTFEVRHGEVAAIVGSSGAGKTTAVNLLPRFHDVGSGEILLDGIDVREFTLDALRRQFALVTQDVILFDDTIWANIAYGDPAATPTAVKAAAKAALVEDFVTALPEQYETRIGERGLRLSGGERQRISIARALLKNAPILILDEATSSLDAESEVTVQHALENLMRGRTTIVIAHRLSTIRRADRIVALADGRVAETGTHDELIARRGVYWKLYNVQFATTN